VLPTRLVTTFVLALLVLAPLFSWARLADAQDATPTAQPAAPGVASLGGDLPGDPQIQLIEVASGMANPVNLAFPPDDSGRMFVVSVDGFVRIVEADGTLLSEPFLDLSDTVALRPGQQGLLGLAFHPNYAENGRFYVAFNNLFANGALSLSEFQIDADNPNQADPRTERPLLVIDKPYPQHNGGTLRFGPEGYLYMATGDGGWQGDPYDNAQSRFSLLGKILRIDVDGRTDGHPYGIPADNPFSGPGRYDSPYPSQAISAEDEAADGAEEKRQRRDRDGPRPIAPENRRLLSPVREEIWAFGFRNPWQFSFDPATGDFYVGDVGAENWEEINFQPADSPAGQNYGWDWLEASHCFPPEVGSECPRQQVGVLPIAEYEHGDDGCAVIGLGVYRSEESPELDGIYFSGEYCSGEIRGLQRDENGVWQFQNLLDTAYQITGSGQDANGDLYVTAVTTRRGSGPDGPPNGSVWKLVAADKVPEGATTIPLGTLSGGDVEVDEEGNPIDASDDEAADEPPAVPEEGEATPEAATAEQPAATPVAEQSAAATEVTIEMLDIFFAPDRVRIPANTDVRLVFPNNGQTVHNFALREKSLGVDISIDVEPGLSGEAMVNLPPGNYKFVCDIPGHKQAGMTGVLAVS
jgi:glucose/arabinose dehydrogenase/plastocyanin